MVKKYYIHPMAFGSEQNPGYGHVEVIKYEDYTALKKERNRLKAHLDALAYSVLNAPLSPDTEELAKEVFDV